MPQQYSRNKRKEPPQITEEDIGEFLRQTEELQDCSLVKNPPKIKVHFGWNRKTGTHFDSNMPDKEAIRSLMATIRPFIEYRERLHLGRVITYLLEKHGESDFLKNLQEIFNGKSSVEPMAITVNDKPYVMQDMMILYMYGKYLHLDAEKQQVYRAFEATFGPLAESFALSQVERYVGIVLGVAGYIKKNKLHSTLESKIEY